MITRSNEVSRRGFLAAFGAATAAAALPVQAALPWGAETVAGAPPTPGDALASARSWYMAAVDAIVRGWEPRFRFRQFRPDAEGDYEGNRRAPRQELEDALAALTAVRNEASACLVLAVTPSEYEDGQQIQGEAASVMALDVLARAEALGYFAVPCPESLRFPDLPELRDGSDDIATAERNLESARSCATMYAGIVRAAQRRGGVDPEDLVRLDEHRADVREFEARLTGMRDGTIPALTERQKVEAWQAERLAIVADYRRRLEAAGVDASWVSLPVPWEVSRMESNEAVEVA